MPKEEIVKKWLEHVGEDISAAECLLRGGHWLYVCFLCHQAIEKALKAYWTATLETDPPYTHSHIRLISDCGLENEFSESQMRFIAMMEPMYIEARYPEQKTAIAKMLDKQKCISIFTTTKELVQWIEQLLQKNRHSTL